MTLIKICGVTHPDDAAYAAQAGAERIGFILWEGSKRGVTLEQAKKIVAACRAFHAEPIPVFVKGDQIEEISLELGVETIQLHGAEAKQMVKKLVFKRVCAVSPFDKEYPNCEYLLFDNAKGGSGISFDWSTFTPPTNIPWILAGGITCANVVRAIEQLQPYGIDVSTGVEISGTVRKDKTLIKTLIALVKEADNAK